MSSKPDRSDLEAAAFRRLLAHLDTRRDVQNIELMTLAGFCRNCLATWYQDAAEAAGTPVSTDEAREAIYGMPYSEWKAKHERDATPEELARLKAAQAERGETS